MAEQLAIKDTLTEMRIFSKRVVVAAAGVLLLAALLLGRYFHLQIVEHEKYRTASDRNRIHARAVPPRRGLIFDRDGTVLADNRPTFNLMVTRERSARHRRDARRSAQRRFRCPRRRRAALSAASSRDTCRSRPCRSGSTCPPRRSRGSPINRHRLPGVEVEAELVRHYPFADAARPRGRLRGADQRTGDGRASTASTTAVRT
jgi:penicillin-binding protein 2